MTPDLVKWLWNNAIVSKVTVTPYGTVYDCENYVVEATPEELEERRRSLQRTCARLLANQERRAAQEAAAAREA